MLQPDDIVNLLKYHTFDASKTSDRLLDSVSRDDHDVSLSPNIT